MTRELKCSGVKPNGSVSANLVTSNGLITIQINCLRGLALKLWLQYWKDYFFICFVRTSNKLMLLCPRDIEQRKKMLFYLSLCKKSSCKKHCKMYLFVRLSRSYYLHSFFIRENSAFCRDKNVSTHTRVVSLSI